MAVAMRPGPTRARLAFDLRDAVLGRVEVRRALDRDRREALYREIPLRAARELPHGSPGAGMAIATGDSRLTGVEPMNPTADFPFLPGLARR